MCSAPFVFSYLTPQFVFVEFYLMLCASLYSRFSVDIITTHSRVKGKASSTAAD